LIVSWALAASAVNDSVSETVRRESHAARVVMRFSVRYQ
jgi:hypothetical protein